MRSDFSSHSPMLSSTTSDKSPRGGPQMARQLGRPPSDAYHAVTSPKEPRPPFQLPAPPVDGGPTISQERRALGTAPASSTSPARSSYPAVVRPPSPQRQAAASPSKPRAMSIHNLLADEPVPPPARRTSQTSQPAQRLPGSPMQKHPSPYRLTVRQQPIAARCCGFGERDRRVIDPPPILQLTIDDPSASEEEAKKRLKHPFLVVHCSIFDESGTRDMTTMPEDVRAQKRLMGTLVSSPFVGTDEDGAEGCFFAFPDLSCRTNGVYRLKFVFVVIDPAAAQRGSRTPIVAEALSEPFTVYSAKDFPGMRKSTPLTKRLKEQGCLISLKKGNERVRSSRGVGNRDDSPDDDDDDDDNDDEEEGGGPSSKSRKKARTS